MPAARKDDPARRRVVPERAGRSLWLAAAWTGAGTAVVGALVAIAVVAICWLPVSGTTGRVRSTIHAGLLSFLASVHGGITVDGVSSSFLPLGMIAAAGLVSWRAGTGLADVAADLDERDPARLTVAAAAQAVSFVIACLVVTPFATLGSSEVPFLGVGAGSLLLFVLTGGVAFARASGLARVYATRIPACLRSAAHGAVAATAVYLGAGALLVAGSLAVHHARVEALSAQVGGGWGGVPVLLLGVLAAPNATIAGASYLAGPGFAVGSGTSVTAFSTAHGTAPAFPLLGALPVGHGADVFVRAFAAVTVLAAGLAVARSAWRAGGWPQRLRDYVLAVPLAGGIAAIAAWQGGGAVGDGPLHTVGASPGWLGLAVTIELAAVAGLSLGLSAAWQASRGGARHPSAARAPSPAVPTRTRLAVLPGRRSEPDGADKLAG